MCSACHSRLGSAKLNVSGGLPWCEACYLQYRAPRCMACHEPVTSDHMIVLGMPMHHSCFKCEECKADLTAFRPAENNEGKLVIACPTCYDKVDCKRKTHERGSCGDCGNAIAKNETPFLWEDRQWHQACFRCAQCADSLGPQNIPVKKNDRPHCQKCCQEADAPENRCNACRQIITDVVVKAKGSKYHRHCVKCAHCQLQLMKEGTEQSVRIDEDGNPCCDLCYRKKKSDQAKESGGPIRSGNGFLQIRIARAIDLFKDCPAREAYVVFQIGLQMLYTGKRVVSKAQRETVWDEVWEFRKIEIGEKMFRLDLMHRQENMGNGSLFLKDLIPGISTRLFEMKHGTLEVEFTWRPHSAATRDEAFQKHWRPRSESTDPQ